MSEIIDKDQLYGRYQKQEDRDLAWRNELAEAMTAKALDIPRKAKDLIQANRTYTGIGTWGVLAIAVVAVLPALLLAVLLMAGIGFVVWKQQGDSPMPTAPQPAAATSPADSEYDVRFYDQDGIPIVIPHISTKPK